MKLIDREVIILKSVRHENIIALKEVFETAQVGFKLSFTPVLSYRAA